MFSVAVKTNENGGNDVKVMGWTPSMLLSVVSVYHYGQETFEKRIKSASVGKT